MGEVVALPKAGDVFCDIRGDDRTMRVSRHDDRGMVVVSLWAGRNCRASFRLPLDEVSRLVQALGAAEPLGATEVLGAAEPLGATEVLGATEPLGTAEAEPAPLKPVKARWWQRFAA